jgi:hypothetical protein
MRREDHYAALLLYDEAGPDRIAKLRQYARSIKPSEDGEPVFEMSIGHRCDAGQTYHACVYVDPETGQQIIDAAWEIIKQRRTDLGVTEADDQTPTD